jgi:hypothetical protein
MFKRAGLIAVLGLLCTACLGAGHATGHLYKFNREFENKWAREGIFLLLIPGYVLTSIGDNFIFNSIHWWTGENPIDPPRGDDPSEFGI